MTTGQILPPVGSAVSGLYVLPPLLWACPEAEPLSETTGAVQGFSVETYESLRSREELEFFDWSIGILGDAGIAGVLKNDYVYQASTLQGEIHTGAGRAYSLALSKTSVDFGEDENTGEPLRFTGSMLETDGEELEANQIGRAFNAARRQSALLRAWRDCTSMKSTHSIILKDLRTLFSNSEFAMDMETDLAEFTVTIRRTTAAGVFRYTLTDAATSIMTSPRVADAVLCDAAEEAGGDPEPASILFAIISAIELAQRDAEWLAASFGTRMRRV